MHDAWLHSSAIHSFSGRSNLYILRHTLVIERNLGLHNWQSDDMDGVFKMKGKGLSQNCLKGGNLNCPYEILEHVN